MLELLRLVALKSTVMEAICVNVDVCFLYVNRGLDMLNSARGLRTLGVEAHGAGKREFPRCAPE
jgi:hypothetical protein